jgi:hypothetical protein
MMARFRRILLTWPCKVLQELGFEHIIFNIKGEYSPETLKLFTEEIIPGLKG